MKSRKRPSFPRLRWRVPSAGGGTAAKDVDRGPADETDVREGGGAAPEPGRKEGRRTCAPHEFQCETAKRRLHQETIKYGSFAQKKLL